MQTYSKVIKCNNQIKFSVEVKMRKESVFSIIDVKDEKSPARTGSLPEPTVFLALNVNRSRFPSICNTILYVLLFLTVIGVICLFIMMIIAWAFRDDTEITTKPPFERKLIT